jgi:hypothetical protein
VLACTFAGMKCFTEDTITDYSWFVIYHKETDHHRVLPDKLKEFSWAKAMLLCMFIRHSQRTIKDVYTSSCLNACLFLLLSCFFKRKS